MATELRVEVGLVEEGREEGLDGGAIPLDGVVERVRCGDGRPKREGLEFASLTVVVEVSVVTADGLVV